jgi:LysM repeat protein
VCSRRKQANIRRHRPDQSQTTGFIGKNPHRRRPALAVGRFPFALPLDVAGKAAFHCRMKQILFSAFFAAFSVVTVWGQDAATQAQIDKLSGQVQDLLAAQGQQTKRLDALETEISGLRDKVSTPAASESASADDLKKLAAQVQEIDKKRQDDRDLILKEIEKLGKSSAVGPGKIKSPAGVSKADDTSAPASPQKGYEYKVQAGDTLSAIAKAYRDQGVKVTATQILKANPKLDPAKLFVGQKIFIPDPNAK